MPHRNAAGEGRVVIVTGASTGIGYATAHRFGRAGDRVLITARTRADLDRAARQLANEDIEVVSHVADVGIAADVRMTVSRALAELGPINVLVNNAGRGTEAPFVETDDLAWQGHLETNLRGTFLMTREVARHMVAARGGGVILNTSSINAVYPERELVPYAASKAGIDALTRGLAVELAPYGIRVCGVRPGYIDTPMISKAIPSPAARDEYVRGVVEVIPVGRLGEANEIAEAFFFLASVDAAYITGTNLNVDGGRLAAR